MGYSAIMKTRWSWLAMLGALLLALAAAALDTNETQSLKVYPLDPNNAAILDTLRALVGQDGLVTPDRVNSRVLVITTAARHAQIKQAVPSLVFVPRNIQVEVRFRQAGQQQQRGVSVGGHGTFLEPDPMRRGSFRVHGSAVDNTITTSGNTVQLLTVSNGRQASMFVGREVPYLDYLMDYVVSRRLLPQSIAWEQVGSSLLVQPTIIGDGPNINIRLIPQLSGVVAGKPYSIQLTEVATEVDVADRQTMQIGGLGRHADFFNRFLVGVQEDGSVQSLNITLTPKIMPAVGPH